MKKLKFVLLVAFATVFSLGFTACSDDDDDNNSGGGGNGSGNVEVNDLSVSLQHAYYWVSDGEMQIEFYNFDPTSSNYPSKYHFSAFPMTLKAAKQRHSL